jgi:hypothetical protein
MNAPSLDQTDSDIHNSSGRAYVPARMRSAVEAGERPVMVGIRPLPRVPAYEFYFEDERVTDQVAQALGYARFEPVPAPSLERLENDFSQAVFGRPGAIRMQEDELARVPGASLPGKLLHGRVLSQDGPYFVLSTGQGRAYVVEKASVPNLAQHRLGSELYISFDGRGQGVARSPEQHFKHELATTLQSMGVARHLCTAGRVDIREMSEKQLRSERIAFDGVIVARTKETVALALRPQDGDKRLQLVCLPSSLFDPALRRGDAVDVVNEPARGAHKLKQVGAEVAKAIVSSIEKFLARTLSRDNGR